MAKDNKKPVVKDEKVETTNAQDESQNIPDSARTNGERDGRGVRTPTVGKPVETSFDERTSAVAPFLKADGTQDNGAVDLSEPEGARRVSAREGDKTTVEETDVAIEKGIINDGAQNKADLDREGDKPKNPVK